MFDNSHFPDTLDPKVKYTLSDTVKQFEIIGCKDKQKEYMLDCEVFIFDLEHPSRKTDKLMRN